MSRRKPDLDTVAERQARGRITRAHKRKGQTIEQRLQYLQDCAFLTMRAAELLAVASVDGLRAQVEHGQVDDELLGACALCLTLQPYRGEDQRCTLQHWHGDIGGHPSECGGVVHPLPST